MDMHCVNVSVIPNARSFVTSQVIMIELAYEMSVCQLNRLRQNDTDLSSSKRHPTDREFKDLP